ncbi:MAG TPA: endopeptidase La [Phycisphaerae bacterium]|nr:endopeptidase La [Phycisphaerae bacterium]
MTDEQHDKEKDADDAKRPVVLDEGAAAEGDGSVPLAAPAEDERDRKSPEHMEVPEILPVLPIRDTVAFPGTVMPLTVSREKSKRVLDLALAGSRVVAVVAQRTAETEDPQLGDLYRVGTACAVLKLFKLDDGTQTVIVHGIARVGLESMTDQTSYLEAKVHPRYDTGESGTEIEALVHSVRHAAQQVIEMSDNVPDEARVVLDSIRTPGGLADFVAANLSLGLVHKQELLETFDVKERLRKVHYTIAGQVEVLELSRKIQSEVRGRMEKSQREYFLREQLKAIQSELGQADARSATVSKLEEKIVSAKMPEEVEAEARRELERLGVIPQASPEYSVAQDYVEWLCTLPWSVGTEDRADIRKAGKILDEDHYGLGKVKRRILEFLAVRQLQPETHGPILCFAGPPGVGKTSLGRSIARALGRKFIRMSLGGAHDEADIRGHRRTYIGALPGRIMREIAKAGSNNPLFMLDEVDKLGQDFRGDPASALLEVLDPAQNSTFTDHYLDVPFDLSKVLFITTANYMDPIPVALLDRMEVMELPGYTLQEKIQIAKRYLVPRQLDENGLKAKQVRFDEAALRKIVSGYTREAGVRNLERTIGAVCRARAVAIVRKERRSGRVTARSLARDLGAVKYESEVAARISIPGVVTGLAFTPTGGEILFIEATRMPGNGNLNLTGQLGSVMRESSQAAFSIVRSRAADLDIDPGQILQNDYHIHVPAGAIPKDGPSAGVAMLTSLVSLLTDRAVNPGTAMTGEITLRGRVLPVGGIKEKVLAAHRAGLTRVIMPERNVRDLDDVPEDVREEIEFVPVRTIDQVLKAALDEQAKQAKQGKQGKRTKTRRR